MTVEEAAAPLRPNEIEEELFGDLAFDADGFIVGEDQGRVLGFAHAGFGRADHAPPLQRVETSIGTVAMLVVDRHAADPHFADALLDQAVQYLRERGASVIYAGGAAPLNPFYWGLYGGSEFFGILSGHPLFHETVRRRGFQPISRSVLLRASTNRLVEALRDPRSILIRRRASLEVEEDITLEDWWDAMAIGSFQPTRYRVYESDGRRVAQAMTWEMALFGRRSGTAHAGLVNMEVALPYRRQGFGRFLVGSLARGLTDRHIHYVNVQTLETNAPALALYRSVGFQDVEQATLYRLEPPAR